MCKSSKMRVSKRLIATSIIYGGAEARLRGVLEPPEPPPVHATDIYGQSGPSLLIESTDSMIMVQCLTLY